MKEVIIIGKGPSGISCAIYLKRANIDVTVIGNSFGALEKDTVVENYYGFEKIKGKDLINKGINQAKQIGIEVMDEEVIKIEDNYTYFRVVTDKNVFETKSIVLATGKKRTDLKVKNYQKFIGKGISFCATCDGFFFKNKKIGVVGNSEFAISEYNELRNFTEDLILFSNGLEVKNELKSHINLNQAKIIEVNGSDKLNLLTLENDEKIELDALFIALGVSSGLDFARHLGINIDNSSNNIVVDNNYSTNIAGIFAIGDCIGGVYQIAKATSDGCIASKSIIEYIKKGRTN